MTGDVLRTHSVTAFVDDLNTGDQVAICGLFRRDGGASRVIQQQAVDLTADGYDVTVIALEADMVPPNDVDLIVVNPVQDHVYLSRIYWVLFPLLPVLPYVVAKLLTFDIVIAHRYPFTIAGRLASLLSDSKYVYWSHPSGDPSIGFDTIARVWVGLVNWLETQGPGVASADQIVAVSDESREHLSQYVDTDIVVVQNTVNPTRFPEDPPVDRIITDFGIDTTQPVALYVGRITQKKNVHRLIDVFQDATADGPAATLVVTGAAPQDAYYQKLRAKASDDIVFTGYVTDAELAALYMLGDVFVTCSLEEGWGLPISEAMYYDLDVVAFDSHPAAVAEDASYLVPHRNYEMFRRTLRVALDAVST